MQKLYRYYLVLIFAGLVSSQIFGSDPVKIKGIVKDQKSGLPISFAHIYIPELNLGTASNLQGEFIFECSKVDSITVSAIGYSQQVIYLQDSLIDDKLDLKISLIPKAYELAEIKIRAYPTYVEFKRGILDYEMTPAELNIAELNKVFRKNMAILARRSDKDPLRYLKFSPGLLITSPITAIYNVFSRDVKNELKFQHFIDDNKIKERVAERLNFEIITTLTGLQNEDEISDFIAFCDFSDTFILSATEIQLYNSIVEKFKEYILLKPMT